MELIIYGPTADGIMRAELEDKELYISRPNEGRLQFKSRVLKLIAKKYGSMVPRILWQVS